MAINIQSGTMRPNVGSGHPSITIPGACSYDVRTITLYELYQMGVRGRNGTGSEISTAEDFLQRPQQIVEWQRKERKRCKEFIRSIIKGNGKLDNIVIIPIKDVYNSLLEKENLVDTEEEREAIKDSLQLVSEDMESGSKFYCIDGQNRIFQAIVPFFQNEYSLDTKGFAIFIDGKSATLSGKSYKHFPDVFKTWFNNIELILVEGREGDIDGFTNSLIWKNEGIPWTEWMKTLTKKFHSKYARQLKYIVESEGPVTDLLYKMSQNKDYIKDVRGCEYFVSELLLWMLKQKWPDMAAHEDQFELANPKLDKLVENLKSYLRALSLGSKKDKSLNHMTIKNYVMLRFALDNPNLFPNIDIPYITIQRDINFVAEYKSWHDLMKQDDDKYPDDPRWPNNYVDSITKSGRQKVPDSYVWANSDKTNYCIEARIRLLCDRIRENYATFLDEGVLTETDTKQMPGMYQVMDYHNRIDAEGKVVDILDIKEYERGHGISDKHGGTKDLKVIKPEKISRNRSYQEEDH